MNATFTSYAAVRMMPAGQLVQQQRTIRRHLRQNIAGAVLPLPADAVAEQDAI